MAVELTKKHRDKMIDVLNGQYKTVDEAASAVLDAAVEMYESRAKFAVVGQVKPPGGWLSNEEGYRSKVLMGVFPTEKKAEIVGRSLAFSNQTGEEARWWCVPVWHGTPFEWYKIRKAEHEALEAGETPADKFNKQFER